jgi:hypothetical protein
MQFPFKSSNPRTIIPRKLVAEWMALSGGWFMKWFSRWLCASMVKNKPRIGGISLRPLYSEFVLTLFCQSGVREFPCRNVHSNPTAANG